MASYFPNMKNRTDGPLNWNDAPAFLAVARVGSLTAAAVTLGSGVATVSRRIDRLEAALGVRLFARHQSGYSLTDDGETLLPKAEALEDAMRTFDAGLEGDGRVTGHVRLATAENLANPIIIPALGSLLSENPGLSVEMLTDVATVNLHRRDADLAVRMVRPERGRVTVRKIGTLGFGLYGSPDYVANRSVALDAPFFETDRFIGWSELQSGLPAARWLERTLQGRQPILVTTTLSAQLSAASAGLGLAILPHFLAHEAGLRALPVMLGLDQSIWLVIHADLSASRRVRAVADCVKRTIQELGPVLKGEGKIGSEGR